MHTALVTGITGQDGGYLAERLVRGGGVVHGLVREGEAFPEPLRALGDHVVLHPVELRDDKALARVLKVSGADEVYNLVGVSSVALSWIEPAVAAEVNGAFVARLLQRVWEEQQRRGDPIALVQASSAEIFGSARWSPQDETTPMSPRSPYGASKAFAHHLVQVFRARGLHASNAILYNHESPRRPVSFVTRKITSTVAAIAEGRADHLVLGNLDAQRDWGWAPEYVEALILMARHDRGDDFIVATGVAHSVAEFVAAAFNRVGISDWERYVTTDEAFVRPVDPVQLVGDPAKARKLLGWVPRTGFEELVGLMVDADLAG